MRRVWRRKDVGSGVRAAGRWNIMWSGGKSKNRCERMKDGMQREVEEHLFEQILSIKTCTMVASILNLKFMFIMRRFVLEHGWNVLRGHGSLRSRPQTTGG